MAGDVNISDETVQRATGKDWGAWMAALDVYGLEVSHAERARLAGADHPGVDGWWIQMVTVEFERRRGLREVGQSSAGDYQVSCSKTVPWPVDECYRRVVSTPFLEGADWTEGATWNTHDGAARVEVRRADGTMLRWFWFDDDAKSTVTVDFWPKEPGAEKRSIVFAHSGLGSAEARERYRAKWKEALRHITAA